MRRVHRYGPRELSVSSITAHELLYGARRHPERSGEIARVIDAFLENLEVLPFDTAAAARAAEIRAALTATGKPIGAHDTLIAGHALARDATLVIGNVREFGRVPGLRLDSWS